MHNSNHLRFFHIIICLMLASFSVELHGAEFLTLGDIVVEPVERKTGLSDDGRVAIGSALFGNRASSEPLLGSLGYRWTEEEGIELLGKLPVNDVIGDFSDLNPQTWDRNSQASSISQDGSVIVGSSGVAFDINVGGSRARAFGFGAFRWTRETGMQPLGGLDGYEFTTATDVSADGGVIVGRANHVARVDLHNGPNGWLDNISSTHFRWTADEGMQELALPEGYDSFGGFTTSVSSDGSTVIGDIIRIDGASSGYRWTSEEGIVPLDPNQQTVARAVSGNGSVIVGRTGDLVDGNYIYNRAIRWTQDEGVIELTGFPSDATFSNANTISQDGSLILGYFRGGNHAETAILWDDTSEVRELHNVLSNEHGLGEILTGWELSRVSMISADMRVLFGSGVNPDGDAEHWIVRLETPLVSTVPEPASALLLVLGLAAMARPRCRAKREAYRS